MKESIEHNNEPLETIESLKNLGHEIVDGMIAIPTTQKQERVLMMNWRTCNGGETNF